MKRDSSSLSSQKALRIAIVVEARNAQLYGRLAEMFSKFCPKSPEVVSSLFDLAEQERQHGVILTTRYLDRYHSAPEVNATDEELSGVVERPTLAIGDVVEAAEAGQPEVARRMIFEMVAEAERSTVNYYSELAETTLDASMKFLYQELLAFEQGHTDFLERELAKLKL